MAKSTIHGGWRRDYNTNTLDLVVDGVDITKYAARSNESSTESPIDLYAASTTALYDLGTRLMVDERVFHYARAGEASFAEESPTTIDMSGFTALTGKVDLDIYNSTNNSIIVAFDLAGVAVGNPINLNDYIATGDFAEQGFAIPKADLGLTTQLLDGMTITMTRLGGTKPTVKFDDIQFEQTGTPAVFQATTPLGTRYHIDKLRFVIADALDAYATVAGDTENATLPALSYDKLLGLSALSNGIVFQRVQNDKVLFSVVLKQLSDFLGTGSTITNAISDGTNTFISMEVDFLEPIVLEGSAGNFLSLTVSDNLSGLLQFTAAARGALEV